MIQAFILQNDTLLCESCYQYLLEDRCAMTQEQYQLYASREWRMCDCCESCGTCTGTQNDITT